MEDVTENYCTHTPIRTENGWIVCQACGMVMAEMSFGQSVIDEDALSYAKYPKWNQTLPSKQMLRALKLDRMRNWAEKRTEIARREIRRLTTTFTDSWNIVDAALILFKKASKHREFQYHNIDLVAHVCVLYIARTLQFPLEISIIPHYLNVKQHYYLLLRVLQLPIPKRSPLIYMEKFGATLHVPVEVISTARTILQLYMRKYNTSGKSLRGITAGVLYFASVQHGYKFSQRFIANTLTISDFTLRVRVNEIKRLRSGGRI